jgi:hypothetical protein
LTVCGQRSSLCATSANFWQLTPIRPWTPRQAIVLRSLRFGLGGVARAKRQQQADFLPTCSCPHGRARMGHPKMIDALQPKTLHALTEVRRTLDQKIPGDHAWH